MYEYLVHILYLSHVAKFELTEINNIFKFLGEFDKLKVRTLRRRGYLENVKKRTGPIIDEIERTYCLNGPHVG